MDKKYLNNSTTIYICRCTVISLHMTACFGLGVMVVVNV